MKKTSKYILVFFIANLFFILTGCQPNSQHLSIDNTVVTAENKKLNEDEYYYSKQDVADYIHQYKKLPPNYITKNEAEQKHWSTSNKEFVIGGNKFGNREGKLPKKQGRKYYEADIQAGYTNHRGPQRIIYSNDGLIFYTGDHYETFEQLY